MSRFAPGVSEQLGRARQKHGELEIAVRREAEDAGVVERIGRAAVAVGVVILLMFVGALVYWPG